MGRLFKKNWKKVTGVRGKAPVRQKEIVRLTDVGLGGGGGGGDVTTSGLLASGFTTEDALANSGLVIKPGELRFTIELVSTEGFTVSETISAVDTSAVTSGNLPAAPATGVLHIVKDQTGNAVTSGLVISGNGNNIDGAASYTITNNYEAAFLVFDGDNWMVV